MKQKIKPSLWWMFLAAMILIAGIGGGLLWLFQTMTNVPSDAIQFRTPGKRTFELIHPGTYVLWHDAPAVFQGQAYDNGSDLPEGLSISLANADSGEEVFMRRSVGTRRLSDKHVRHTVGKFDVDIPGDYELTVAGDDKVRIFAMGPSYMGKLAVAALGCVALNLAGWIGSLAIAVTVLVKRTQMKRVLPDDD